MIHFMILESAFAPHLSNLRETLQGIFVIFLNTDIIHKPIYHVSYLIHVTKYWIRLTFDNENIESGSVMKNNSQKDLECTSDPLENMIVMVF